MACQQLGSLATLFTVQPIFLRPVVHDTAIFEVINGSELSVLQGHAIS